jgi:hypothetical protein
VRTIAFGALEVSLAYGVSSARVAATILHYEATGTKTLMMDSHHWIISKKTTR